MDVDFFQQVSQEFSRCSKSAVIGATIWHRSETVKPRIDGLALKPSYIGCGHAIRVAAYRQVRGYLPRPVAYGMEESDLSLQLFAAGWKIYESRMLRVFHDTDLNHHQSSEITAGVITNVGLFAFLNYPYIGWCWAVAQLAHKTLYCLRRGRIRGICAGLLKIPSTCYHYRRYRNPVPWRTLSRFLEFNRTGIH
jgi:GT2 family glycosyltransferase